MRTRYRENRSGAQADRWARRAPLAIAALFLIVQVAALFAMGHPAICECGYVELWHPAVAGPGTSQHLTDWYTYTHVVHGAGYYLLLWLVAPPVPFGLKLSLAIGMETGWEVLENTPMVIDRYRQSALAQGYFGDSILNSVADTAAAAAGFVVARALPSWFVVGLLIALELFLGIMIRDNLILNIIQLIAPSDAITRWQTSG